ncbi:hypothetical protein DEFDS_0758 [Deferribacter desulfuricans SSM1]|uniref:peptidylprolyl isomerase n=2 Tax=Deferribacter TaxID=53572 RepID=D3PCB3_DEFDS|nr:hypothetical protein DEFDS_0758 [Deferribacter desulfuricans SSM1]
MMRKGELNMRFILNCAKILIFIMVLVHSNLLFAEDKVVAKVNEQDIHLFEVKSFLNKVVPIGRFHTQSLNKKEYWEKALNTAIDSRAIVIFIKNNNPEIYNGLKNKVNEIIKVIKKRFKSNNEYAKALKENGITEKILYETYMDLNVKDIIKEKIFSEKIEPKVLKEYYKNNQQMFSTGESYVVKNCLIKADARELKAKEMEEKKKEAENLLKMLKEEDEKAWQKCDKGIYPEQDTVYKFSKNYPIKEIFKLKKGDFGGPYRNIYGYLIVKVIDIKPSEVLPFDEIKNEIERLMKLKKFKDYYKNLLKRAKDEANIKILDNNFSN